MRLNLPLGMITEGLLYKESSDIMRRVDYSGVWRILIDEPWLFAVINEDGSDILIAADD